MVDECILKTPEQKEYPITNFNLETGDGEILKLQNVSALDLGILYEPNHFSKPLPLGEPFEEGKRKIRIFSPRGNMEFFLSEIKSISFSINNEENVVFINTVFIVDKKETKDGKNDD